MAWGDAKWKPGQSGNAKGRAKVPPELTARLRRLTPKVMDFWEKTLTPDELGNYGPHAPKVAELVAAYNLGPPENQRSEHDVVDALPLDVDQLRRLASGLSAIPAEVLAAGASDSSRSSDSSGDSLDVQSVQREERVVHEVNGVATTGSETLSACTAGVLDGLESSGEDE